MVGVARIGCEAFSWQYWVAKTIGICQNLGDSLLGQSPERMNRLPQRLSLVAQTAAVLKDEIKAGRWTKHLPGEHELCAALHVGRVTLRSALDQLQREGWVRTSQGRRREIVGRHGFHAEGPSHRVILLTPVRLANLQSFTIFWIDGLREHLAEEGYHLEVHEHTACYSGRPDRALESLASRLNPAGWVLSQSTARMQRWFSQRAAPCVITGSRHAAVSLPSVDLDYRAISRHAAGLLLARGHRRLAFFNPGPVLAGDYESEEGFKEGVEKSKQPGVDGFIARHNGGVADICVKLDAALKGSPPPTAFLVSRPNHVVTVMSHLLGRGLRFPNDVALISRDHDSFLDNIVPSVARYLSNPSLFARTISNLVIEMVRSGIVSPKEHRIMAQFVAGQTLG